MNSDEEDVILETEDVVDEQINEDIDVDENNENNDNIDFNDNSPLYK